MSHIPPVTEKTLLPDLLRSAPWVRPVLDRYGLRGCGGPDGPVESIAFFARAHDVELDGLLGELRAAAAEPGGVLASQVAPNDDSLTDAIYRPFFKAGIAVVLTLGAAWGAFLLLRIGWQGSFAAVGLHEVNAHGHAQIFGWVGLFVMGFAYQAFPRFKHTNLVRPRLARASLWLMLAGLVARAVLEPAAAGFSALVPLAIAASLFEILAVAIFCFIILSTWQASGKPLAIYDYYVLSALFWFVVQAIYDAVYAGATLIVTERQDLLDLVATWQGPLREIQIHGFATLMILGVSQRVFPNFYGLPAPHQGISKTALVAINLAVVGEVVGLILMRTGGHAWAGLWYASVWLLGLAVLVLVRSWRIFTPAEFPDRSLKFLRAAYIWLFISLDMLVLMPAYQFLLLPQLSPASAAAEIGFSHAYYGAVRHAITVGFISLMIVGVAAKVTPTLNGVDIQKLTRLWGPFLLINAGCALRVTGQIFTDLTATAFPITAVSGLLEVSGLAWWGGHLWRVMSGRYAVDGADANANSKLTASAPIEAGHRVGEVLELYPQLLNTFLAFGFTPLQNPVARKMLAHRVSIAQACSMLGVALPELLRELNRVACPSAAMRMSLPVMEISECRSSYSHSSNGGTHYVRH